MTKKMSAFIKRMNDLGSCGTPFLFIIDSALEKPEIHPLDDIPEGISFSVPILKSEPDERQPDLPFFSLKTEPVPYKRYLTAFSNVMDNIRNGKTYLLNLTFPTKIITGLTLKEIYRISKAPYRILYHNEFVVFSPEPFVTIEKGRISSYPMKGTIDASVPGAEGIILNDKKEKAEHDTIVDLIRNDLAMVSENVSVVRYRYIEKIKSFDRVLLQVSSEISGSLPCDYKKRLGEIIVSLLPAGSVTGAPKKQTVSIIKESEKYSRGWYTGVFGFFDGERLDSGVMIRFIEKNNEGLFYKSGGGITFLSDPLHEYEELNAKVYVPVG